MKGANSETWKWIAVAAFVAIILNLGGIQDTIKNMFVTTPAKTPTEPTITPPVSVGLSCPDTKTLNIGAIVRNPLNATLFYSAQTVRVFDASTGKQLGTITTNQQTSGVPSYATLSVSCPGVYKYYILGTTTMNSAQLDKARLSDGTMSSAVVGSNAYVDFEVPHAGGLKAMITDANLNNLTIGDGTSGSYSVTGSSSSAAQAIASGDTKIYHLKVLANTSFTQFGTNDFKPIFCLDANPSVYSKTEGTSVTGGGAGDKLPDVPSSVPSADSMDVCYEINPIKTNEVDFTITVKADLGEPGTADDITARIYDKQLYLKKDGTIGVGYTDDAVARIGLNDDNWLIQVS